MSFKSKFTEYSNPDIPTFLRKDNKTLKDITKLYSDLDFDFLIKKIIWYWIQSKKDQIIRRNLCTIIESLIPQFSVKNKKALVSEFSKKILYLQNKWINYPEYFYELKSLILLNPPKDTIISIYKNETSPQAFSYLFDYCIKNNYRDSFEDAICQYTTLYESTYNKEDFKYFDLRSDENIDYIWKDLGTINIFLKSLITNHNALFNLIDWYHLPEEKILNIFSKWDKLVSQEVIKLIIKKYFEDREFEIDRIIKSNLFISILWTQRDESIFIKEVFSYLNDESRQYYTITTSIIIWLISYKLIDLLFKYNRWNQTILSVYYSFPEENIEQKKIKNTIFKKYSQIIEDNNQKNEEYRKENEKRLNDEEKKIKEDIVEIISKVTKLKNETNKNYFSSRILYLYKNHKELFEEDQLIFVEKQIDLYFTSDRTNPWNSNAKVDFPGWNQFSWPRFIPDLQLCLEIALNEWFSLWNYIERIIYLIPYLFDSEYKLIVKLFNQNKVNISNSKHINWILKVYSHNSDHWKLWYFHPHRLISLFNDNILSIDNFNSNQKEKLSKICENMVKSKNERISMREKESYFKFLIKNSEYLDYSRIKTYNNELSSEICDYNYFEDYLHNKIEWDKINVFEMFCYTNEALIEISQDVDAIKRRLNQLKWIKTDYVNTMKTWIIYWISRLEDELIRWRHENKFFYTVLLNTIKYNDYESDIVEILRTAENFKWENSEIKNYLYRFIAEYYKSVPSRKKIKIYAWIDNKEFVIYYLWAAYWTEKIKQKYKENIRIIRNEKKIEKKNKYIKDLEVEVEKLKYEKEELENKYDEANRKLDWAYKLIKQLEEKINKLENKTIILTEWKTDRKHLKKVAKELKNFYPNEQKKFNYFLDNCVEYDCDMGEDQLDKLIIKMANLFPKYKIIWIIDTDWKTDDLLKKYKIDWEHIYKIDNIKNMRLITIPEPWNYNNKKMKNLYNNWWCTELLYNHSLLKDKFILCWNFDNYTIISKYGVPFYKIKYNKKNILIKKSWDIKWGKHSALYDINCGDLFFDTKWNPLHPLYDKETFAEEIQANDSLKIEDIKNFKPLFDILYEAYQHLAR